jgi:hypothetical protein
MNLLKFLLCILPACYPVAAADQLTGFPFQNETLRYTIKWPSGVEMGEATISASKADAGGWRFDMNFSAGVPGFPFADTYRSQVDSKLCSSELNRAMAHGAKKVTERTTFDQQRRIAERKTLNPAGGGTSELQLPACAMDALAYHFLTRREMGQGRVPQQARVFFGSGYDVRVQYTGAMDITVGNKSETTDRCNVFIKGPASDLTVEVYYARDAARTPVLVKIPASIGSISLELVRR